MKNYYKVLGISESATINEIVDAYKMLAPQYHPDNNKGDEYAQERFIDLSVAYKTLINSDIRKDYDRILKGTLETDGNIKTGTATASIDLHDSISQNGEHNTKLSKTVRYVAIFSILFIIASIAITIVKVVNNRSGSAVTNTANTIAPIQQDAPTQNTLPNSTADNNTSGDVVSNNPIVTNTGNSSDVTTNTASPIGDNSKTDNTTEIVEKTIPNTKPAVTTANKTTKDAKDKIANTKPSTDNATDKKNVVKTDVAPKVTKAPSFTVESSKSDVLKIQGTPTSIVRYKNNTEVWSYGASKVVFVNDAVATFKDAENNLKTPKDN